MKVGTVNGIALCIDRDSDPDDRVDSDEDAVAIIEESAVDNEKSIR